VILARWLVEDHCGKVLSGALWQAVSKCGSFGTAPQGDRDRQNCGGQLGSPSHYHGAEGRPYERKLAEALAARNEAFAAKNRVIPK
jgi:hypothetical protein